MDDRLIKRFVSFGAIWATIFAVIFSLMWLVGAAAVSLGVAWICALLIGVVAGAGYAALYWFYGFVPKSKGGRAPDQERK